MRRVIARQLVVGCTYRFSGCLKSWKLLEISHCVYNQTYCIVQKYDSGVYKSTVKYTKEFEIVSMNQEENESMENQLYQLKDQEVYGFVIATNSQGKSVFEVKGTGEVKAVDKDQLVEVMPYTVGVKFLAKAESQVYHFFGKEGELSEGDVIAMEGYSLAIVHKVDTKSKSATKWIKGTVLQAAKKIEGE